MASHDARDAQGERGVSDHFRGSVSVRPSALSIGDVMRIEDRDFQVIDSPRNGGRWISVRATHSCKEYLFWFRRSEFVMRVSSVALAA